MIMNMGGMKDQQGTVGSWKQMTNQRRQEGEGVGFILTEKSNRGHDVEIPQADGQESLLDRATRT